LYDLEEALAFALVCRVQRVGMEAAVGIAANRELAHLAACGAASGVIPPEREREFINWLPLDCLNLVAREDGAQLAATLARWGLKWLSAFTARL